MAIIVDEPKNPKGPKFVQYFVPVVEALRQIGGSGSAAEVRDRIIENLNITDEQLADTMKSGNSRVKNQIAWARFYLSKCGIIDSSTRGVWSLTKIRNELPTDR